MEAPVAPERAGLVLAVGEDRQHGGNDGYDDEPDAHYSWDSTVPNHAAVRVGDRIVLWDKRSLLGSSTIEAIETGSQEKILRRCPACRLAGIKSRRNLTPRYKCYKCKTTFDDPVTKIESVTTYRSRHDAGWVFLEGKLDGPRLRGLCDSPKSQLSLRPLRWADFRRALAPNVDALLQNRLDRRAPSQIGGGHKLSSVRVRIGQRAFRQRLLKDYGAVCALTGPAPCGVLEAGHLYSYAALGEHHVQGGLLLRRDIHRLFDDGDLAVNPETQRIDVRLALLTFPSYRGLANAPIQVGITEQHIAWIRKHWAQHREGLSNDSLHTPADNSGNRS